MSALTLTEARARDAADPLAPFRARFELPEGITYLDGNSLGALPKATPGRIANLVSREWGADLIRSWNANGWMQAPYRIGAQIAPLIGAAPHEVVACDSTSVNLYKLVAAAFDLRPGRRTVLSEPGNFPTDLYAAQSAAQSRGGTLRLAERDAIAAAIDADTAIVLLTHVHYKSAALHDMAAITRAAQAAGALVLWDLSHSVGAVELALNDAHADLAVGCGYKYLNGGPGAPAFAFVAERHQAALRSPLSGWMGHKRPFAFTDEYEPADGIARLLSGTPSILALAALEVGVALVAEAGMPRLAAKSRALSTLLVDGVAARAPALTLASPADAAARGSHVSFAHPDAYAICQALIARGVIGDFRAPDLLRLGVTPLYTSFEDVWRAVETIAAVLDEGAYRDPAYAVRQAVT